jgi:hypothetical protein
MLQDRATCDANHRRFVERVITNQCVWYLKNGEGVATSTSNYDDEETENETTVLMFWSDRAYASRVKNNGFENYEVECLELFNFLYRWLPGMTGDRVLAGTNWSGDLIGVEKDPFELREEIEASMPETIKIEYEMRAAALMKKED